MTHAPRLALVPVALVPVALVAATACGPAAAPLDTGSGAGAAAVAPLRAEYRLEDWQLAGVAGWDWVTGELVLTENAPFLEGGAFATNQTVPSDCVGLSFSFWMGGGTGGEGIALTLLDSTRATTLLGPGGCGMGYGADPDCAPGAGLPGWSLELDAHTDGALDGHTGDHAMLSLDGALDKPLARVPVPTLASGSWRAVEVEVVDGAVSVWLDGQLLQQTPAGSVPAFPALVGVTASTCALSQTQRVRDLRAFALPQCG